MNDNQEKLHTCPACGDYGFYNPVKQCAKTGWVAESKTPEPINTLLLEACEEALKGIKELRKDHTEVSLPAGQLLIKAEQKLESTIEKAKGE